MLAHEAEHRARSGDPYLRTLAVARALPDASGTWRSGGSMRRLRLAVEIDCDHPAPSLPARIRHPICVAARRGGRTHLRDAIRVGDGTRRFTFVHRAADRCHDVALAPALPASRNCSGQRNGDPDCRGRLCDASAAIGGAANHRGGRAPFERSEDRRRHARGEPDQDRHSGHVRRFRMPHERAAHPRPAVEATSDQQDERTLWSRYAADRHAGHGVRCRLHMPRRQHVGHHGEAALQGRAVAAEKIVGGAITMVREPEIYQYVLDFGLRRNDFWDRVR